MSTFHEVSEAAIHDGIRVPRVCTGGPNGSGWCGKDATCVPSDDGLRWYACDDHTEGKPVQTMNEWWAHVAMVNLAEDTKRRLAPVVEHREWCRWQTFGVNGYRGACNCGAVDR